MIFKTIILLVMLNFAHPAEAALRVLTTTTNAKALVEEIGGDLVHVESLTKGSQDPHYVEAKPSFMMKASKCDLLVSIGLDLEIGWLPSILRGARNGKVMPGQAGSLVLGNHVTPMDIPHGGVTRDQGDVHPDGNPHFMLDPVRAAELGLVIGKKLSELDPANGKHYQDRAQSFQEAMLKLSSSLKTKIAATGIKKIITHHKTLTYFLERMGVHSIATVEPKPGVPPSASHILGLIKIAKVQAIKLILVENYFEMTPALRVQKEVPGLKVSSIPVSVEGDPEVKSLGQLYQAIAKTFY
jgi:zinc/manganese transport system substrate-binding protein